MASVAKLRPRTFQEVDCRRDVEKKSHPKGVERDGQGHYLTAAMTSLVIAWFRSPQTWNPKSPGPPPVTGAFFLSADKLESLAGPLALSA
jgi:hypothetical protein